MCIAAFLVLTNAVLPWRKCHHAYDAGQPAAAPTLYADLTEVDQNHADDFCVMVNAAAALMDAASCDDAMAALTGLRPNVTAGRRSARLPAAKLRPPLHPMKPTASSSCAIARLSTGAILPLVEHLNADALPKYDWPMPRCAGYRAHSSYCAAMGECLPGTQQDEGYC